MMAMTMVIQKLLAVMTAIYLLVKCLIGSSCLTYTVDRIEEGQDGEKWVVVEVYNSLTDEIRMVDIKVEEGFVVAE